MIDFPITSPTAAAVGSRVAPVSMPTPFADLSHVLPGLSNLNQQASGDLLSMLQGQLSPGTINQIQNYAATRGISGGMPGANIFQNLGARSIGTTSENLMQQGLQSYSPFIQSVAGTQTVSPALQTQINEQNAVNAAAPDPVANAAYSQQLFQNYLKAMQSPAGGTGSGFNMQLPQTFAGQRMGPGGSGAYGNAGFGTGYGGVNYNGGSTHQNPYTVYSTGGFGQYDSGFGPPEYYGQGNYSDLMSDWGY